jgi:NTP pyrophosphatase (non-canonical NTP hydrolase)
MHINEFQKLMHTLYFPRDSKRGKDKTLDWLKDEVEELKEALNEGDIQAAEKEFADVLAWLASLANIVNIDLEKAALSKYDNKCPKCGKNPCDCPFKSL